MWTCCDDIGVVGAKLLKPDGTIQHAGVIIGLMGFAGHVFAGLRDGQTTPFGLSEWYRNVLAVTAACLGIRRQVFEEVGGFSEDFILCGNDVELCLRVQKAGYRVLYHPFVRLLHEESATRDGTIPIEDFRESFKCYQRYLRDGDPYFNPNLSHWSLTPALREAGELAPERFAEGLINDVKVS
jgi:GT2 family glycosyltransferase